MPGLANSTHAFNADRVCNRFLDYPRLLLRTQHQYDVFHLVDHSYAQLLHHLPVGRVLVTCHDLDTFWSVLDPAREPRNWAFRRMMERTLSGLRKAALVTCPSRSTRSALLEYNVVAPERVIVVPNGVDEHFTPQRDSVADERIAARLGPPRPELLHVGSTIPRKRIDLLLEVFARVRRDIPDARLLRVGSPLTREQRSLATSRGILASIDELGTLTSRDLAAVYRRASVVLQPSSSEGFGLPVAEALACGATVIASDLPVLREVGGTSAQYCPVGDVEQWSRAVVDSLRKVAQNNVSPMRLAAPAPFSWIRFTQASARLYSRLLTGDVSITGSKEPQF